MKKKKIKKLYKKYNEELFGRVLPKDIEINVDNKADFWACASANEDMVTMFKIIEFDPTFEDWDFEMTFNKERIAKDEVDFRAILLHEMVHIWQYVTGKWVSDHDKKFLKWIYRIEQKTGVQQIWDFEI